ncbi:SCO family protein [Chloroflexales bacterium ZM16-3]|nr:SCO family protein [Chloroflexales bacterium ZM16-3]
MHDTPLALHLAWLKPLLIGAGVLLGTITTLALWFALAQPVKVMPRVRTMPAFLLTDQDGRPVGDAELRGRMVLLGFSYTRCGAGCAELNRRLQDVRAGLATAGLLGSQIAFATISLDPAHDTPDVLRAYAAQTGADLTSWAFLTGAPEEIKGLAGGELGIYYEKPAADGSMIHDQEVLLIDEKGILRARYTPKDLTMDRLNRDLGLLGQERNSSGVMRQVYEVSHLFLCYPD